MGDVLPPVEPVVGVLLAAGRSERFGSAKLHALLPETRETVGVASCRALTAALRHVVAVVRPGDVALAETLAREGARVVVSQHADEGLGASLAAGIAAAAGQYGYLVALADMPWIAPSTIRRVAQAIVDGAGIAAPVHRGRRGHPVAFSLRHRDALLALRGDEGARSVVDAHRDELVAIDVDDPGVLADIDTPADLRPNR
jgi:molybdenum cofactor cytidylyltransferase